MLETSEKWEFAKIKDFLENDEVEIKTGPFGSQLHASDYVEQGIPIINARHIRFGTIADADLKFVSEETAERMSVHMLRKNDIVFARVGPTDRHALIRDKQNGWLQGTQCIRLRFKSANIDPLFVSYYFLTPNHIQWMTNNSGQGTAQPYVNQEIIQHISFPCPPISIQQRISSILFAYDTLTENNRRRIQILEEMARLIYREWFVHFRFPGHEEVEMVDSEMGEIPNGWIVSSLGEECELIVGQSPKSQFYNEDGEGLPFHQGVKDFGEVIPNHRVYCTIDKRVAKTGDILFSVRAPVGRINLADTNLIVGRGLHAIRHNQQKQAFLLYQLKNRFFKEDLMGGGTVFQAVTKGDMLGIELLLPSENLISTFEEKVGLMVQLIVNLTKQNQILSQTRDLLLPRLVTGEIDVSEMDIDTHLSDTHKTSKYKRAQSELTQWLDGDEEDGRRQ